MTWWPIASSFHPPQFHSPSKPSIALLKFLGESGLPEDDQVPLQRTCIQAYPRLINYGEGFDAVIDQNGKDGNAISPEADAKMQEHYKLMYSGEREVREVIEALQKYKVSNEAGDQDLFACNDLWSV